MSLPLFVPFCENGPYTDSSVTVHLHKESEKIRINRAYGAETWTLTKQAQKKLAAAQTKVERSMLNITYKDKKTNIWVREKTKVIDNLHCEKNEMVLAGHINRLKDDRWTSRVTTWRPCDRKRRQGRPAKRWRDDLVKYSSHEAITRDD